LARRRRKRQKAKKKPDSHSIIHISFSMFDAYIVIGLGNPGRAYKNTRHNMGFIAVERFVDHFGGTFKKYQGIAEISKIRLEHATVFFIKPLTFMNNSGQAVSSVVHHYKVDLTHILVVCDDIALPLGRMRLRSQGSSGGHKGLDSIIASLHTQEFARLRIGIGRDDSATELTDFVLSSFSRKEKKVLETILPKIDWTIKSFILNGLDKTMTVTNSNQQNDLDL
jgi:PTH1 family peptidyl-tRNA hydrolase